MKSPLLRAANRWQNLRERTVFQINVLEREKVIPATIAETLRAAIYEADETLQLTAFNLCERCNGE